MHRSATVETAMTQDELKQAVAREAIKHVVEDAVIGVGTGSTANFFIDELARIKNRIAGAVASSEGRSEEHTSELQSRSDLVCRLLLENKTRRWYTPTSLASG